MKIWKAVLKNINFIIIKNKEIFILIFYIDFFNNIYVNYTYPQYKRKFISYIL